jgi:predicted HNH restriction endonuclease
MGKRLPTTPRSKVRAALRRLSLQSRERSASMKAAGYRCQKCGAKQSRAKGKEVYVEAHHKEGIVDWEKVIDLIYDMLLVSPDKWTILCKNCHKDLHEKKPETET